MVRWIAAVGLSYVSYLRMASALVGSFQEPPATPQTSQASPEHPFGGSGYDGCNCVEQVLRIAEGPAAPFWYQVPNTM